MSTTIGRQAVVVGAGMGGLTAARALADYFERVLILERDVLPSLPGDRAGIPQGKHVHALLGGGQSALAEMLPGFEGCLRDSGAVPVRVGLELRMERSGYVPFPARDLGWDSLWMSRAQIEFTVRHLVCAVPNVEIAQNCRVAGFIARPDGSGIQGIRWTDSRGVEDTIASDIVIDATSEGRLTLNVLDSLGRPKLEETTIGVDVAYSTAVFAIPEDAPVDWKGVFCLPQVPKSGRGGLLGPLEGGRWILTLAGRRDDVPPGDADGFMAYASELWTPTIYNAIKDAKRLGEIARFRFPESRWRHYERLASFPRGLLPIGDAICRFNPIYGQGMSVAAQEARALQRLFASRQDERDPLGGIASGFFAEAQALIDTPWANAAMPDLAYSDARGERPADFEQRLKFGAALTELSARDPAVHKLIAEVQHLLKPRTVYQDPDLVKRVLALMAGGRV